MNEQAREVAKLRLGYGHSRRSGLKNSLCCEIERLRVVAFPRGYSGYGGNWRDWPPIRTVVVRERESKWRIFGASQGKAFVWVAVLCLGVSVGFVFDSFSRVVEAVDNYERSRDSVVFTAFER